MVVRHLIRRLPGVDVSLPGSIELADAGEHVPVVTVLHRVNPLECRTFVQNRSVDQDVRGPNLDRVTAKTDQPFDIEFATRGIRDVLDIGGVEDNDLTAVRFPEVIAELVDED